jgi:ribosomal protein S12 methylthiotransferase accessory factor YcaO
LVQKPSDIIQEWSVKKEANQYTVTMGIAIDTSDAQAALAALEEQIQSSSALKVLSGAIRDGAEPYYGVATLCSTESSNIEQQTLSTVLGNTLHTVSSNMASSTAVELAQAVKTAFDMLDNKNATTR